MEKYNHSRIWLVWDPLRAKSRERGPQRTRPREHARSVVVDSWPVGDGPPTGHDALQWDAWRLRRGVSGVHS